MISYIYRLFCKSLLYIHNGWCETSKHVLKTEKRCCVFKDNCYISESFSSALHCHTLQVFTLFVYYENTVYKNETEIAKYSEYFKNKLDT